MSTSVDLLTKTLAPDWAFNSTIWSPTSTPPWAEINTFTAPVALVKLYTEDEVLEAGVGVNVGEGLGELGWIDFGVGEVIGLGKKTVGLANGVNLEGISK